MSYLGAKSGSGVYQVIINLMPPHDTYIEPFLGSGAIMKLKPAALVNIGLDLDSSVLESFKRENPDINCELFAVDALEYLTKTNINKNTLIYLDPPYMHSTRTSQARYKYEMTDNDHARLLDTILSLDCDVVISGYRNQLYDEVLGGWFSVDFQAMTRGGVRTETVWCNFNPSKVHYHTYAGQNFTDRQRIKRKAERWAANFKKLPPGERQAVLAAILAIDCD